MSALNMDVNVERGGDETRERCVHSISEYHFLQKMF
jgi:hypothetical protein